MVSVVDESIGLIRQSLRNNGLEDNTLILFTSDQGGAFKNAHLRGGKMGGDTLGEGGARVPFILYYPGVTTPNTICHTAIQTIDVYPTLIEIVSGERCEDRQIQGLSLMPILQRKNLKKRKLYFFRSYEDQYCSVLDGFWKLIKYRSGKLQLYNLENDESEVCNLINTYPEKAAELAKDLAAWESTAVLAL